jgi:hypothetical protein
MASERKLAKVVSEENKEMEFSDGSDVSDCLCNGNFVG